MTDQTTEAAAVAEIVERTALVEPIDLRGESNLIGFVVPAGRQFQISDLERYQHIPNRKKGTAKFHRHTSFSTYVSAHATAATTLYGDVQDLGLVAVLDGHEPNLTDGDGGQVGDGEAGWGDHRAELNLRTTPAWDRWAANSAQLMGQEDFGQFLEDSVDDIRYPDAADLIELSRMFEATKGVAFKGAHRPVSGQRVLRYEETIEGRAGTSGEITIPETFKLGLAPFEGAGDYEVIAKFRFRIRAGGVELGYVLDRPELRVEAAFGDVVDAVQQATGREVLHGSPA